MGTRGHSIGGRIFLAMKEGTVLHDLHFRKLVAQSGLSRVFIRAGEDPDHFARRLLDELVKAGVVLELIGCLLIPVGKRDEDWTPEMAQETAAFFGGLKDPVDKAKVDSLILTVLIDFFANGFASLWTSPTSSEADPVNEQPSSPTLELSEAFRTATAMGIGVQLSGK